MKLIIHTLLSVIFLPCILTAMEPQPVTSFRDISKEVGRIVVKISKLNNYRLDGKWETTSLNKNKKAHKLAQMFEQKMNVIKDIEIPSSSYELCNSYILFKNLWPDYLARTQSKLEQRVLSFAMACTIAHNEQWLAMIEEQKTPPINKKRRMSWDNGDEQSLVGTEEQETLSLNKKPRVSVGDCMEKLSPEDEQSVVVLEEQKALPVNKRRCIIS